MRHQSSWVQRWSAHIIEIGWLAAIFCIPSFFNLLSSRHFEPDKALLLRSIIIIMSTFVVVNQLETHRSKNTSPARDWRQYIHQPLLIAVAVYIGVLVLSTITSIVPSISFWGSYQRLQGTYTTISYITLALIMVYYINNKAQVWRIVQTLLLSSLIPTFYGYVQYLELDPLPWKGDVITRVASTLGNSIFIAAYLILIVPFALANGIQQLRTARSAPQHTGANDWLWLIGHAAHVLTIILVMYAGIQFSAVIRSVDTLFWWIYPTAIACGFAVSLLLTSATRQSQQFQKGWLIPAVIITLYALITQIVGLQNQDIIHQPNTAITGVHWNWWMWGATLTAWIGVLSYARAPRGTAPSRQHAQIIAGASFLLALANWVTIILSQSRGPWIGGAVGILVFFVLYAVNQIHTNPHRARAAKQILVTFIVGFVALFGFIVVFNFADIPILRQLRDAPYIGRMGRLFDISPGTTGDVRMKIWFGDTSGTGTVGLILSNPIRTVIGWGPESMFAAYTPFYPPSLANIESRSATPDRSHQAFLDELVNKGILGLLSYLAVLFLALQTAWKTMKSKEHRTIHLLIIASMSALASHLAEGMTGIPIVITLMIQWIIIAFIFKLSNVATITETEGTSVLSMDDGSPQTANATMQSKARKAKSIRATAPISQDQPSTATSAMYLSIVVLGFIIAWTTNIDNIYADMRFQQGQTYNNSAAATNNTDQQIIALSHYIAAARLEPQQDYYYLNMGRSLLSLAESRRRQNNSLESTHTSDLAGLLMQPDALALKQYLAPLSARDITRYAEEALIRADQLYPLNKDHSANLARLYLFWFNRIEQNQSLLDASINWFEQSTNIAPNDVSIINDYAGALLNYANIVRESDPTLSAQLIARADTQISRSLALDQRYKDTTVRLGDLARARQDYDAALSYYDQALSLNARALDSQITTIINQLVSTPEAHPFLRGLRDIYARIRPANDTTMLSIIGLISSRIDDKAEAVTAFAELTQLQPQNLEAQQNYTLVLSNAQQYDQAYVAAERLYNLAEQAGYPQATLDVYATLREYFATKR